MSDAKKIIEALLQQRVPATFRAGGPSMNPTIRDGETVRIRPLRKSDFRIGSILLQRMQHRLVLHRMIRRDRHANRIYIVADAAVDGGEWVAETDLLGVAEWVRRQNRTRCLDCATSRLAGWLRYAMRPLRRALIQMRPPDHAGTPSPRA